MDYDSATAHQVADRLVGRLERSCEKIQIAGSLRRRRPVVHDIEIVAQPLLYEIPNLLGQGYALRSKLNDALDELIEERVLRFFPGAKNGERMKQFLVEPSGIKVDLFIVLPPAQWGAILAIRTGPSHYSHWLVTPRIKGGGLPSYYRMEHGALWQGNRLIETPTEESFFAAMEIDPMPAPESREPAWRRR
jgi:DNA polymerase/3'-5' exonuclease PolX